MNKVSATNKVSAVHALRLGRQEDAQQCWLEAFRSDTTPAHYLRLLAESHDFSIYREEAGTIYRSLFETVKNNASSKYQPGDLKENRIDRDSYYMLSFLDGDFSHVLAEGMNTREVLGWSSTFIFIWSALSCE